MRTLLVINLLVVICVLLSESAIIGDPANRDDQLFHFKNQIEIVHQLLKEECLGEVKAKRAIQDDKFLSADLEVQKLYYNALLKRLIKCRERNEEIKHAAAKTSTMKTVTTATPTTTEQPAPAQCLSATNLTESWRMDHDGKNLKAGGPNAHSVGWACDFRRELQWFRFTEAAGSQMLNKCPKVESCGSQAAMWTDAAMPTAVGVPTSITVYGSISPDYSSGCKAHIIRAEVMRCSMSTDHDFIYRYIRTDTRYNTIYPSTCDFAFCGMM